MPFVTVLPAIFEQFSKVRTFRWSALTARLCRRRCTLPAVRFPLHLS